MPPKEMAKVTLKLSDGTKIVRVDSLTTVQDFLEEHQEFVKVVRCRDCKHYFKNDRGNVVTYECELLHERMRDDFYCADGKRREDG